MGNNIETIKDLDMEMEIDTYKSNTAVSTGHNIVESEPPAGMYRSDEVLLFFRNDSGVDGTIMKMGRKTYLDTIVKKINKDYNEILQSIDGNDSKRNMFLESALLNINNSSLIEIEPIFIDEKIVYKENVIIEKLEKIIEGVVYND